MNYWMSADGGFCSGVLWFMRLPKKAASLSILVRVFGRLARVCRNPHCRTISHGRSALVSAVERHSRPGPN